MQHNLELSKCNKRVFLKIKNAYRFFTRFPDLKAQLRKSYRIRTKLFNSKFKHCIKKFENNKKKKKKKSKHRRKSLRI